MLSQENKVSQFCMDAEFIHVVEIGQYFMTKDTGEQFFAKACREYTLPRSDESSQQKVLSISSVSTEQWQLHVKNLRTIQMDRGNLRF